MRFPRFLRFPLAWFLWSPPLAWGWDDEGHAAIGMTAMSAINGEALTQLKRLLNGRDAVDAAGWGHKLATKYPLTESLMQQLEARPESGRKSCDNLLPPGYLHQDCSRGGCLLDAVVQLYSDLSGAEVPKSSAGFKWPLKLKMTDADKVKLLINLIGDIHQPMRVGFSWNNGGRDTTVKYYDQGKQVETSLFRYWETDLIQKMVRDRPNIWFSGWTHVGTLGRATLDDERMAWDRSEADRTPMFVKWILESRGFMCTRCMQPWKPIANNLMTYYDAEGVAKYVVNSGANSGDGNGTVSPAAAAAAKNALVENSKINSLMNTTRWISNDYVQTVSSMLTDFEFAKSRLLLAGARTSFVLNSILASRDARKLRRGSGVLVAHEADYKVMLPGGTVVKKGSTLPTSWVQNLAINASIMVVVLAIFFALTRRNPFAMLTKAGRTASSPALNSKPHSLSPSRMGAAIGEPRERKDGGEKYS